MPGARSSMRMLLQGAAGLCLAAALVGCSHTVSAGNSRVARLVLTEYRMNPGSLRVPPGELTIVVRNLGRLTHNLTISRDDQEQAHTMPLPPGSRSQLTVVLTPGSY